MLISNLIREYTVFHLGRTNSGCLKNNETIEYFFYNAIKLKSEKITENLSIRNIKLFKSLIYLYIERILR